MNAPRLFISYSWTTPELEQWVLDLATELRENGVDAILDKWDLKEGQDADAFMEQMVSDPTISKVLIVSDKKYAEKSDKRKGGVGTEAQIISRHVYEQQDESKFVVAACELNEETGKPYLPVYYTSRKYIDFTDSSKYAEKFEELLRWIYDRPQYVKPMLGKVPEFIIEDERTTLGTSSCCKRVMDAFLNGRSNATGCLKAYLDTYAQNLDRFRVVYDEKSDYAEDIKHSIDELCLYRNEWLEVISRVCQYNPSANNISCINQFFERVIGYTRAVMGQTYPAGCEEENYKFLVTELYLLFIAVLLKNELFEILHQVLCTVYYDEDDYAQECTYDFRRFRFYLETLRSDQVSPMGDLLYRRAQNNQIISQRNLCQADFFLCFYSLLHFQPEIYRRWFWYPSLLVYGSRGYMRMNYEVFARAESIAYFEKFKVALGVVSKEELSELVQQLKAKDIEYLTPGNRYRYNIAALANVDKLATK